MRSLTEVEEEIASIVVLVAEQLDGVFPTDTPEVDGVNSNFCGQLETVIKALLCGESVTVSAEGLNVLCRDYDEDTRKILSAEDRADQHPALQDWLKENHSEVFEACISIMADNSEYSLMDACDTADSRVYHYWSEYIAE